MNVSSILEIYTTFSGWIFNNVLVDLLKLGFFLLPFLFMIIMNMREAAKSGSFKSSIELAVKTIESDFYEMILVAILFFVPFFPLDLNTIQNVQPERNFISTDIPREVTAANDPSQYANSVNPSVTFVQTEFGNPKVPIMFFFVMKVAHGFEYTLSKAIRESNARYDIGAAEHAMSQFTLNDPGLTSEFMQFSRDCFERARSNYLRLASANKVDSLLSSKTKSFLKDNPFDINYYGSVVFQDTAGLYKPCNDPAICFRTLQASQPIEGWSYNAARDGQRGFEKQGQPGQPLCNEWWASLRTKIVASAPDIVPVWQKVKLNLGFTLERREEDLLAENVLRNSFRNGQSRGSIVGAGLQADRGLLADIHGILANEGLKVTGVFSSFKRNAMKNALVLLLAVALMLLYINLPLILLFTGFRIQGVVIASGLIFVLIMSHFILAVVEYIEVSIYTGAYAGNTNYFNVTPNSENTVLVLFMNLAYPLTIMIYFIIMGSVLGAGVTGLNSGAAVPSQGFRPTRPPLPVPGKK